MLTLYHCPRTRSSRVLWMLEELGQPYSLKLVDIRAGEGRDPAYRKLHPHGKVPALEHDGVAIYDSTAILLYLADRFPESHLAPPPQDPRRGPYLAWMTYTPGVIEPAIAARRHGYTYDPFAVGWGAFEDMMAHLRQGAAAASPYLLGEDFTAADILIGGALHYGMLTGSLPVDPILQRYSARVIERPACQRANARDAAGATGTPPAPVAQAARGAS